ncbi:MAG: signal peptidase II [bacterium]|nr:signal peptidase II [bacterium]
MVFNIKKITAYYTAVIFYIVLDRLFKALALKGLEFSMIGHILQFSLVKNYYIAFSLPLAGIWLNAVIGVIILCLIYYWLLIRWPGQKMNRLCLSAVILGAGSNLFDRLAYGYVIDYFNLKYFTVFNLADALIVAGVAALIFLTYKKEAV